MTTVTITEAPLAIEDLLAVVDGARVDLDDATRAGIAAGRAVVDRALARDVISTTPATPALGAGTTAALLTVEEVVAEADPYPDAVHRALRDRFPDRPGTPGDGPAELTEDRMEPGRDRVAVVTGARQGLGRVVAEQLAGQGYALALLDIAAPPGAIGDAPVLPVEVDVSDEAGVRAAADRVLERFGRVDVLVNNAGISLIAPAEDTPVEQWRRVLDVNLTGPFLLCQAFGRGMLERGGGSIVNVASIAGLRGVADRAAYNASKHGLIGLTRTLAVEWGGRGVRVNAVCPGWIKTEMDVADQGSGAYTDDDIVEHVPMGRFARPEDVAQAVAFLADDTASGFVNGQELGVDGGWHADGSWQRLRLSKR